MFIYDQNNETTTPWASVVIVSEDELELLKANKYLLDYDTDEVVDLGAVAQELRHFGYNIEAMNTDEIISALNEEEIAYSLDIWLADRKPDYEGEYIVAGKKCIVYAFIGKE